jgi:hypothetical protein
MRLDGQQGHCSRYKGILGDHGTCLLRWVSVIVFSLMLALRHAG